MQQQNNAPAQGGQPQPQGQAGPPPMMFDPDMIGAIKIKDGLFIGDELASQDLEFVVANKVTHIINCAGKQIPNHWEPIGVAYLTFFWLDKDNQLLLDPKDEASNAIFEFIEEALQATESVLVHSVRGQSRATCALAAYIMRKYQWSLLKSLEFLNSRRPDLEIRATFINQLSAYEARIQQQQKLSITTKWDELSNSNPTFACEELLLRNTFINSQMGPFPPADIDQKGLPPHVPALKWIDDMPEDKIDKKKLKTNKSSEDLDLKDIATLPNVTVHRDKPKSCMKATIKPFIIDQNSLTGIKNFTQISQNPLAIPADREFQFSGQPSGYQIAQMEKEKERAAEAETKVLKKGSARKEMSSKKEGGRKDDGVNISSRDQIISPSNDMFYKKQQSETQGPQHQNDDMEVLDVDDDDLVQEVKSNKKVVPNKPQGLVVESDFDSEMEQKQRPQLKHGSTRDKMRNPGQAMQGSNGMKQNSNRAADQNKRQSNNFLTEKPNSQQRLVVENESSMTDQEEDKGQRRGSRGNGQQRQAKSQGDPNVKQIAGNITNIINNNNINNYYVNDGSKAPNQIMMQQQAMNQNRVSTAPTQSTSGGPQRPSDFAQRQMYKPPSAGQDGGNRPQNKAQQFRSNSLTNRKDMLTQGQSASDGFNQTQNPGQDGPSDMMFNQGTNDKMNRTQTFSQQLQRVGSKKRSNGLTYTGMSNQTQKRDGQKQQRNESPRSRRQLMNNLTGTQQVMVGPRRNNVGKSLLTGNQMMSQTQNFMFDSQAMGGRTTGAAAHQNSDMTFFDNKMMNSGGQVQNGTNMKRGINSRSAQSRIYAGGVSVGSANAATKAHSSASLHQHQNLQPQAQQFFNRTGPIKIQHKQNFAQGGSMGSGGMTQNQSQQQQVEDMFTSSDLQQPQNSSQQVRIGGKKISSGVNGPNALTKSQRISSSEILQPPNEASNANAGRSLTSPNQHNIQNQGSRQELQDAMNKGKQNKSGQVASGGLRVTGAPSSANRPGTAPQNLNGLLSSNTEQTQQKGQRPMSPFTKVYNNNTLAQQQQSKQKQRQIRTGLAAGKRPAQSQRPAASSNTPQGSMVTNALRSHSIGQNGPGNPAQFSGRGGSQGVFGSANVMFRGLAATGTGQPAAQSNTGPAAQQMLMSSSGTAPPQFYSQSANAHRMRGTSPYTRPK